MTKKILPLLNQPASHSPFRPKLWTALATAFVGIFFRKKFWWGSGPIPVGHWKEFWISWKKRRFQIFQKLAGPSNNEVHDSVYSAFQCNWYYKKKQRLFGGLGFDLQKKYIKTNFQPICFGDFNIKWFFSSSHICPQRSLWPQMVFNNVLHTTFLAENGAFKHNKVSQAPQILF